MNHLEIAEAFFRAMTEEDDQAVRDLCAPDVRPQQNGGPPLDVDALLGFAKLVHRAAKASSTAIPCGPPPPPGSSRNIRSGARLPTARR